MSEKPSTTQNISESDYEAFLWKDLLHAIEYTIDHLGDTGCFQKEEIAYYKMMIKAIYNLYLEGELDNKTDRITQAKTLIVEMVRQLLRALLGCA